MSRRAGRFERGSASVVGVVLVGVLGVVAMLVGTLGGVLVDHRRAESAADLAALAGASAVQDGRDGCAAAAVMARRNRTRVTVCRLDGDDVVVRVERPPREILGRRLVVAADARAGPGPPPA